jgi:hypothetical protein
LGRRVRHHKKADFGSPCDLSHSQSDDGKRGFGCVTPIITLARCVPFRWIAEGTVVILAQRSFFSEAFDPHRLFLCLYSRRDSIARLTRAQSPPDVGR